MIHMFASGSLTTANLYPDVLLSSSYKKESRTGYDISYSYESG